MGISKLREVSYKECTHSACTTPSHFPKTQSELPATMHVHGWRPHHPNPCQPDPNFHAPTWQECKLNGIEIRWIWREVQQVHTMLFNHFTSQQPCGLMHCQWWLWNLGEAISFVYPWKQVQNKMAKIFTSCHSQGLPSVQYHWGRWQGELSIFCHEIETHTE